LNDGQSYQFKFTKPGTYVYYCKLHGTPAGQGMAGKIVVK
jgi:plastocyanin